MASYNNKLNRKGLGMHAQEEEEMDKILKGMYTGINLKLIAP